MRKSYLPEETIATLIAVFISLLLSIGVFWYNSRLVTSEKTAMLYINDLQQLSYEMSIHAEDSAMLGLKSKSFTRKLAALNNNFNYKHNIIILQNIEKIWQQQQKNIIFLKNSKDQTQAVELISSMNVALNHALDRALRSYINITAVQLGGTTSGYIINIVTILLALLLVVQVQYNFRKRSKIELKKNATNQEDINILVAELKDLAHGSLTVQATVKEGITVAVAGAVNYAINALRGLVYAINATTKEVAGAATDIKDNALSLAQSSEDQANEILRAAAAINAMAQSIENVSNSAAESNEVAKKSVAIAKDGVTVVQNTIQGMDNIKQQMTNTATTIKKLGESSQEIGDTVAMIEDIAAQTNILSLNAAIQAATAGDAGKGFAVVADEVQRLAERTAAATKAITLMVQNVQTDTGNAVQSMEETIKEVVDEAQLARDAGIALSRIETVSQQIFDLIADISKEAASQAISATTISKTMTVIQDIAMETSTGTAAAAEAIVALSELVADLRGSVAGFQLPKRLLDNGS